MISLKMATPEQQGVRCSGIGRAFVPGGTCYRTVTGSWRRLRPSRCGLIAAETCSSSSSGPDCAGWLPTAVSSGKTGSGCSSSVENAQKTNATCLGRV